MGVKRITYSESCREIVDGYMELMVSAIGVARTSALPHGIFWGTMSDMLSWCDDSNMLTGSPMDYLLDSGLSSAMAEDTYDWVYSKILDIESSNLPEGYICEQMSITEHNIIIVYERV